MVTSKQGAKERERVIFRPSYDCSFFGHHCIRTNSWSFKYYNSLFSSFPFCHHIVHFNGRVYTIRFFVVLYILLAVCCVDHRCFIHRCFVVSIKDVLIVVILSCPTWSAKSYHLSNFCLIFFLVQLDLCLIFFLVQLDLLNPTVCPIFVWYSFLSKLIC